MNCNTTHYRANSSSVPGDPTHNVECYTAQPRILADFPPNFLRVLPAWFPRLTVDLMDERRTGVQRWLFLSAKHACSADRSPPAY